MMQLLSRLIKAFRCPKVDSKDFNFEEVFRLRPSATPPTDKTEQMVEALNRITVKLMQMVREARYQSAVAEWKSNIAIAIAVISVALATVSMAAGIYYGRLAHDDSEKSTAAIVDELQTLKRASR